MRKKIIALIILLVMASITVVGILYCKDEILNQNVSADEELELTEVSGATIPTYYVDDDYKIDSEYGWAYKYIDGVTEAETFGFTTYSEDQYTYGGGIYKTYSNKICRITDNSQKGNIGIIYHNVGTYQGQVISLKVTITDWDGFQPAGTCTIDGITYPNYPFISFMTWAIGFNISAYPAIVNPEFTFEFVLEDSYVNVNTYDTVTIKGHETFKDLDGSTSDDYGEYFYMTKYDGIDAILLTEDSNIGINGCKYYGTVRSCDGDETEWWGTMLFETNSFSFIYCASGIETASLTTVVNDHRNYLGFELLDETFSPIESPEITKTVNAASLQKYDSTKTVQEVYGTESFEYNLEFYVPYQSTNYYYTNLTITDNYNSLLEITNIKVVDDSGTDVTSYFTITNDSDEKKITISANSSPLSSSDFYNKDYIVTVECNLVLGDKDTALSTTLVPYQKTSGSNSDGWTFNNTATLTTIDAQGNNGTSTSSVDVNLEYSKVQVYHYIYDESTGEYTTTQVPSKDGGTIDTETIEGYIGSSYTTAASEDISDGYEFYESKGNTSGEMTEETNEVYYYYKKKSNLSYKVNYLEKDTNEVLAEQKVVTNQTFENTVISSTEVIDIDGYNYNSVGKDSLTITTGENVINIYYTKRTDLSYTVNYLELGTNEVIQEAKTQGNQTYGDTITSSTEIIDIPGYNYNSVDNDSLTISTDENIINIYYTKRTDLSYVVNYLESGTNEVLATQKTVTNQEYLSETTENAIDITGYNKVDLASKSITIYVSDNVINFYYTKRTDLSYTVNYLELDTNEVLAEQKEVTNQTYEDTITSSTEVISIIGYSYNSLTPEQLTITTDNTQNVINIYYTKLSGLTYTVNYLEDGTNEVISPSKTVSDNTYNDVITSSKEIINIEGYNYTRLEPESLTIMVENDENVINIYYTKRNDLTYTVNYLEYGTGEVLATANVVTGQTYKAEVTENAIDITGYDKVDPTTNTITIKVEDNVINFYYIMKTSVTVKYIDEITGEEIEERTEINGHKGDEYSTEAKEIDGYDVIEEHPENSEGTMTANPIEVIYYYKRPAQVIVNYYDIDTNEKLTDEIEIEGYQNDSYETEEKSFDYYNLVEIPENATGTMTVEVITDEETVINNTIYVNYYYRKQTFNLKVDKQVGSIIVNGTETTVNSDLGKVEVYRKDLDTTTIQVVYTITVTNDSEIAGSATLLENIPDGMTMTQSSNPDWTIGTSTATLETGEIVPGEIAIYKVVFDWNGGESATGTKANLVQIAGTENPAGYEESNTEDNEGTADFIIIVSTGEYSYIFGIGTITLVLIIAGVIIYKKREQVE